MKSITLSLLVAVGLTLGAANAFAETPPTGVVLNVAKEATRQAEIHTRRAAEYRMVARVETTKAQVSLSIAISDEQHGFVYEAGIQRAKAAEHQRAAQTALASAVREDTIAAQYRAQAAQPPLRAKL